jgi:hypothetical protein
MVNATPFLPGLSLVQGKAIIARFDGGRLSSEGGLLVLREVEPDTRTATMPTWVLDGYSDRDWSRHGS